MVSGSNGSKKTGGDVRIGPGGGLIRCRMSTAVMTGYGTEGAEGGDLARRIARAEPGAFEQLVTLYQPRVLRLAHRLLGWGDGAEDVVQDVFLAALRKAGTFRGDASLWTWLTIITLDHCR